jgi:hypothetical protein
VRPGKRQKDKKRRGDPCPGIGKKPGYFGGNWAGIKEKE